jgi:hypothetical protein
MAKFNTGQSFADGDTVTGAKLNNITSQLNIYTGVISEQAAMSATVSTADQLLIADTDNGDSGAANRVTIQKLLNDTLTNGTYTNAQLSGNLNVTQLSTLGTISSTTGTIATLNSTTGTITGLNTTTGTITTLNSTTGTITTLNSTTATIPTLTTGTTTSTAANITNGTVQTLTASTANITTGTVATLNSTTGTITNLSSTTGTVATLNSTTGTITGLNTTTGTITTLNSTTGTITNLSTTLAGDFTISQGTGTIGAAKVTPSQLSQPFTSATAVASTSGTAIDFTGIPSWVKKVTVMLSSVSVSVSSVVLIQIGDSGGIENTSYIACAGAIQPGTANCADFTTGFGLAHDSGAGSLLSGSYTISNLSGNTWVFSGSARQTTSRIAFAAGEKTLSALLDRVRITTVNGTDTFDAGSVNIMYE